MSRHSGNSIRTGNSGNSIRTGKSRNSIKPGISGNIIRTGKSSRKGEEIVETVFSPEMEETVLGQAI